MIYYSPRFALGNIIQTTPAVRYLQGKGQVIIIATPHTREYIYAVYGTENVYENVAIQRKDQHFTNSMPSQFSKLGGISEVAMNLMIAGCTDPDPSIRQGFCSYKPIPVQFDIVIANGYNKTRNLTDWEVKAYPHWQDVLNELPRGLQIASVGLPAEWIPNTLDRTGIGLQNTFGLLKSARLVVTNDTGLYHAAAALGARTLVLFTMTDTDKNHDPVFHKTASIISTGLPCQPCQLTSHKAWIKNRPTCGWACQNINPVTLVNRIKAELNL